VSTRLGLDLQGGTQVLLRAEQPDEVTREEMQTAAGVIERRVNALGVGETVVQLAGGDRIIVELPGVANPEEAIETLRGTGRLEFIDSQGQYLPEGQIVRTTNAPELPAALRGPEETAPLTPTGALTQTGSVTTSEILPPVPGQTPGQPGLPGQPGQGAADETIYPSITDGADLDTNQVQPTFSQNPTGLNEPAVSFAFTGESASRLATFTAQNVGQPMCIVLDHRIVSCPRIQSPLTDGAGVITTNSPEDRDRIYNQLKFGALPVALQVETSRTVSATLGLASVNQSIIAGIVGLVVVALFMMLYYRLPGFLAVVALMIYTALNFAFYRIIPVTLTLAGIAGFILSIGLAVDANVLIFARLKEELRRGKGLRTAIESGFEEAWSAIRDSSVSTLITSAILWIFGNSFGVSIIKGFAITLGLGILLSLFTAVVITRTLLRLTVAMGFANNLWFFELSPDDLPKRGEAVAEPEPETA
jgi:preprotein translocase subunit SecD